MKKDVIYMLLFGVPAAVIGLFLTVEDYSLQAAGALIADGLSDTSFSGINFADLFLGLSLLSLSVIFIPIALTYGAKIGRSKNVKPMLIIGTILSLPLSIGIAFTSYRSSYGYKEFGVLLKLLFLFAIPVIVVRLTKFFHSHLVNIPIQLPEYGKNHFRILGSGLIILSIVFLFFLVGGVPVFSFGGDTEIAMIVFLSIGILHFLIPLSEMLIFYGVLLALIGVSVMQRGEGPWKLFSVLLFIISIVEIAIYVLHNRKTKDEDIMLILDTEKSLAHRKTVINNTTAKKEDSLHLRWLTSLYDDLATVNKRRQRTSGYLIGFLIWLICFILLSVIVESLHMTLPSNIHTIVLLLCPILITIFTVHLIRKRYNRREKRLQALEDELHERVNTFAVTHPDFVRDYFKSDKNLLLDKKVVRATMKQLKKERRRKT